MRKWKSRGRPGVLRNTAMAIKGAIRAESKRQELARKEKPHQIQSGLFSPPMHHVALTENDNIWSVLAGSLPNRCGS